MEIMILLFILYLSSYLLYLSPLTLLSSPGPGSSSCCSMVLANLVEMNTNIPQEQVIEKYMDSIEESTMTHTSFESYSTHWKSQHRGWTFDNLRKSQCRNDQHYQFPVCLNGRDLEYPTNSCPDMKCVTEKKCVHTAYDTIDFLPPIATESNKCGFESNAGQQFPPFYGLDKGIPPHFLFQDFINLQIRGRLLGSWSKECKPIPLTKIYFWHVKSLSVHDREAQNDTMKYKLSQLRESSCVGEVLTDEDGNFVINTTFPVSYGPPRHINVLVEAQDYETMVTRLYFSVDNRLHQYFENTIDIKTYDELVSWLTVGTPFVSTHKETGSSLQSLLLHDTRLIEVHFNPGGSNFLPTNGLFLGQAMLVMKPLRPSFNAASRPFNLTGIWSSSLGGLIKVETKGHLFVASEYPHVRKWDTVRGYLLENVISGVDFRSTRLTSDDFHIKVDDYLQKITAFPQLDTIWSSQYSIGQVLPVDSYSSTKYEGSIEWKGSYQAVWTKIVDHKIYRYLKLEITRITPGSKYGQLDINEIEFYEGILAQREIPKTFLKMKSMKTPDPQKVFCSSYSDLIHHCYKAFDGIFSSSGSWLTMPNGSISEKLNEPQWIMLDLGPSPISKVNPTAMKVVCGASNSDRPVGCPLTFRLLGSNIYNKDFEVLASFDLYDYDNDYANGGKIFYFIHESPMGRLNGDRCGSCHSEPYFQCSIDSYDSSCVSGYCDISGHCASFPPCTVGQYLNTVFSGFDNPLLICQLCPPGRFGNASGLTSPLCSGICAEGCFCPAGSTSECQYLCESIPDKYCPAGSSEPLVVGAGERTIVTSSSNSNSALDLHLVRASIADCVRGHYCTQGVAHMCPEGTYGNETRLTTPKCTDYCTAGYYCPPGTVVPIICPLGSYCPDGKKKYNCSDGFFGNTTGIKDRHCSGKCPRGYYCPSGTYLPYQNKCPPGRYGDSLGLTNNSCSGICQEGYYCPGGSISSKENPCGSTQFYCPKGSYKPIIVSLGFYTVGDSEETRASQLKCEKGFYCSLESGLKFPCPAGRYGDQEGLSSHVDPSQGFADFGCSGSCFLGHYCPDNSTSRKQLPCPAGRYGSTRGLKDANCTDICPLGNYCPEGSPFPVKCPAGVFGMHEGLKDSSCSLVCSDNICDINESKKSFCPAGYYCIDGTIGPNATECGGDNYYCPIGSKEPIRVSLGYYSTGPTPTTRTKQVLCERGYYCIEGRRHPCPSGMYGEKYGETSPFCTAPCPAGHYCPEASFNGTTHRCPASRYGQRTGLHDRGCDGFCEEGYYCPEASTSKRQIECGSFSHNFTSSVNNSIYLNPNGLYCPVGSAQPILVPLGYYSINGNHLTRSAIVPCPIGSYCIDGIINYCPAGRYGNREKLHSPFCSGSCKAGYYCEEGSIKSTQKPCPRGRYGATDGLQSGKCSGSCQNPYLCPPGSVIERPLPTTSIIT